MKRATIFGLSLVCLALANCSMGGTSSRINFAALLKPSSEQVVTLAGPIPEPEALNTNLFGLTGGTFGRQLFVSLSDKKVSLIENGSLTLQSTYSDSTTFSPGNYQVTLKQQNPLWYAPDSYYVSRQLSIPSSGEKDRYLRGAFGKFALFVDNQTGTKDTHVLHSGSYDVAEVQSVRIAEDDLSKIFDTLETGDSIIVQN